MRELRRREVRFADGKELDSGVFEVRDRSDGCLCGYIWVLGVRYRNMPSDDCPVKGHRKRGEKIPLPD